MHVLSIKNVKTPQHCTSIYDLRALATITQHESLIYLIHWIFTPPYITNEFKGKHIKAYPYGCLQFKVFINTA